MCNGHNQDESYVAIRKVNDNSLIQELEVSYPITKVSFILNDSEVLLHSYPIRTLNLKTGKISKIFKK